MLIYHKPKCPPHKFLPSAGCSWRCQCGEWFVACVKDDAECMRRAYNDQYMLCGKDKENVPMS